MLLFWIICAALVDLYITLKDSYTIRKSNKKTDWHYEFFITKVCIYFKLTVSILIGQNVVRHVVLEHKLGRLRLRHKMVVKTVTKMTSREFAEWKNAQVRKLQEVWYILSFNMLRFWNVTVIVFVLLWVTFIPL